VLTDPTTQDHRRRVIATAVVAVLLLGAVALKITVMQVGQRLGERDWRSGDPRAAQGWFGWTARINLVERWIAPYNQGVAAHAQRRWDEAAERFERSYDLAPDTAHCRVALNWAWTLEAAGDELDAAGDPQTAALRWSAAKTVLDRAGECDENDAAQQPSEPEPPTPQQQPNQTQQRLDQKLETDERPPPEKPQPPDPDQQAEQLAERNRDGARDKQRSEDQREGEPPDDGPVRAW
jgi:tetratricopeptide (TPR) repeat protein